MSRGDQDDWRVRLRAMRTIRALKGDGAAHEASEALVGLSETELAAAAENPEHSEAGRAGARARVRSPWRMRVPGFLRAKDIERGERVFFGVGRDVRTWSGIAFFLALALAIAAFGAIQHELERENRALVETFVACEYHDVCPDWLRRARAGNGPHVQIYGVQSGAPRASPASPPPAIPRVRERMTEAEYRASMSPSRYAWWMDEDDAGPILGVGALFVLAPLFIWFIATAFRRKPARVVVLRKFNRRNLAAPLERMMAHELRPYGHVVSLSDKHIRRDMFGWVSLAVLSLSNPLAAAWFVIGAPIRFAVRLFDRSAMGPAVVLDARDYRNLARRLRDRVGLNLQMAFTSREAVLVRTSDMWWRPVVKLAMDSADVIVVDLSEIGAGSAWEVEAIQADAAAARCVFVALWGKAEAAGAALEARAIDAPLFAYAPDGEMQKRAGFREAMLAAMRATHA